MKIIIEGKVISKKNSKQVGVNKYTHRIYVTASKAWKIFQDDALKQLFQYKNKGHFEGPVRVNYSFFFKDKGWLDVDNAMSGINDLLQESQIIRNDRDIKKGCFSVTEGCPEWKTEIDIEYD